MAMRKKKEVIESPQMDDSAKSTEEKRVGQVMEVVEEEPETTEAVETIKKDAQEIEEAASDLEQVVSEPSASQVKDSEEEEAHKEEVVGELFQKESSQIPVEISVNKNGSEKKLFFWALLAVIIALLVGGGLIFAAKGNKFSPLGTQPTPTPPPQATPTPTLSVKREVIKVQVLNGGGVVGAASKMKKFLEDKGYTVEGVSNADEYTFEKTEILVKPDKEAYLSLLEEDLKGDYTLGTMSATLGQDDFYDARVTVGKQ